MSWVNDVHESGFQTTVLDRSKHVPVVVDFWASWCAPCRALGPILEREIEALGGRVELAKVDVDRNQRLAGNFGVQGIPAVMAFRDGKVVADFTGARDIGFVKKWLGALAPSPDVTALTTAHDEVSLRALLKSPEVGPQATLRLARLLLSSGRTQEVGALLDTLPPRSRESEAGQAIRAVLVFAEHAQAFGGPEAARAATDKEPSNLDARWAYACALAVQGDHAGALEQFLEIVTKRRSYREDAARKAMLAIFEILGPQHELTRTFRRRLQMVL